MRFDPLIGGFKSGLLCVSSAPMAQYVCEYDSFCGLSGESSVGYKGWGGLGGGSVGGRPPGGTMISFKVGTTNSAKPSAQNTTLKMELSGAAPGNTIRSRWGKTRVGDSPDERTQQPSWVSPDWSTSSRTRANSKHTSQIHTWKK